MSRSKYSHLTAPHQVSVVRMSAGRNKKQKSNKNMLQRSASGGGGNLTDAGHSSVSTSINESWMPIFPASITRRLRYSTTFTLASTAGAITGTYVFRANDLFDPDFTGTGHQPMGFDQMMTWYNHFCVTSARLTVTYVNTITSTPTAALRVDGDSSAITVIDRVVELGGCVTDVLMPKNVYGSAKNLSLTVDVAKLQGVTRANIMADANLRGTAAASPSEITYFHCTLWDTTATTGGVQVNAVLEQLATFFEPRDVTESLRMRVPPPHLVDTGFQYVASDFTPHTRGTLLPQCECKSAATPGACSSS